MEATSIKFACGLLFTWMKDNIQLLGDKFKAQQLVPFAEQKMRLLKQFMELIDIPVASRFYEFKPEGSTVYIESSYGYEKIRIVGVKKKECPIIEFEFVTKNPRGISLLVLDSSHIAVAYSGTNDKGFIDVFKINTASCNIKRLTSLQHTTLDVWDNSLIRIDSGHLMLAYQVPNAPGHVKTLSIDNSYNIAEIDDFEHTDLVLHPGNIQYPSLVQLDSTYYALNHGSGVWLEPYQIDASYNISNPAPLNELYSVDSPGPGSLVQIDNRRVIMAYTQGPSSKGIIVTEKFIEPSWEVKGIDILQHDTYGTFNSLIKFDATHFVLAYSGSGNNGFIKTFSIDGSFNITQLYSLEHELKQVVSNNSLTKSDASHVVLVYGGILKVFKVDASYNITQKAKLVHENGIVRGNSLGSLSAKHAVLAYNLNDTSGQIKVFNLNELFGI